MYAPIYRYRSIYPCICVYTRACPVLIYMERDGSARSFSFFTAFDLFAAGDFMVYPFWQTFIFIIVFVCRLSRFRRTTIRGPRPLWSSRKREAGPRKVWSLQVFMREADRRRWSTAKCDASRLTDFDETEFAPTILRDFT